MIEHEPQPIVSGGDGVRRRSGKPSLVVVERDGVAWAEVGYGLGHGLVVAQIDGAPDPDVPQRELGIAGVEHAKLERVEIFRPRMMKRYHEKAAASQGPQIASVDLDRCEDLFPRARGDVQ